MGGTFRLLSGPFSLFGTLSRSLCIGFDALTFPGGAFGRQVCFRFCARSQSLSSGAFSFCLRPAHGLKTLLFFGLDSTHCLKTLLFFGLGSAFRLCVGCGFSGGFSVFGRGLRVLGCCGGGFGLGFPLGCNPPFFSEAHFLLAFERD